MESRIKFLFGGGGALCLLQLAVPPLSLWDKREVLDDTPEAFFLRLLYTHVWPPGWLTQENVKGMALRRLITVDGGQASWSWLTHLFVHDSYSHLLGNVSAFLQQGSQLYCRIGDHTYFVYIAGGLAAVCDSPLHLQHLKQTSGSQIGKLLPKASTWLPFLNAPLKHFNEALTSVVMDLSQERSFMLGSSGAVMSVAGCNLVLLLNDGWGAASLFVRAFALSVSRNETFWNRIRRAFRVALPGLQHDAPGTAMAVAIHVYSAFSIAKLIHTDMERFGSVDGGIIVGRAGHLQGAAFGVAYGSYLIYCNMLRAPSAAI